MNKINLIYKAKIIAYNMNIDTEANYYSNHAINVIALMTSEISAFSKFQICRYILNVPTAITVIWTFFMTRFYRHIIRFFIPS